ncbi:MAG: hypothetical protein AAGK37_16480 [Pseudomonadota bacterium]
MAVFYLIIGALLGVSAGVLVGVSTWSFVLGLIAVSVTSTASILLAAAVLFLRADGDEQHEQSRTIPAE